MRSARLSRVLCVVSFMALVGACSPPSTGMDAGLVTDAGVDGSDAADAPEDAGACPTRAGRAPAQPVPRYVQQAHVQLIRDSLGVVHVYADSDEDAFFGDGYAQARDRLLQMEFVRRSALGTAAEVFGPTRVSSDRTVRIVNLARWGRVTADHVREREPGVYALVHAWVSGVNRRLDEIRATGLRPPGFRAGEFDFVPADWTEDDVFTAAHLVLFRNASQLEFDILASVVRQYVPAAASIPLFAPLYDTTVLPEDERPARLPRNVVQPPRRGRWETALLPPDAPARLADFTARMRDFSPGASNNWAVDARHSANGHPILAGDPHQPLQTPAVFWMHHMDSVSAGRGGTLDVIGFSFVGMPGVHLGHNRRVAWTATTTYPDMMDLWAVRPEGDGIRLGGRHVPTQRCVERIAVRGARTEILTVDEAGDDGVLLPDDFTPLPLARGGRLLFRWTGFGAANDAAGFFAMDRAQSVAAFDQAVLGNSLGAFNWIFADKDDIAYRVKVRVPDRGTHAAITQPWAVLDGEDSRSLWTGALLDDARLPHSRGLTDGFLSSANNDPYGFTADGTVLGDPFYYGVWFDPGTRAARIRSELARTVALGPVTAEQMKQLQLDTHSMFADRLLPLLRAAWSRVDTDPALSAVRNDPLRAELATLVDVLDRWDGRASVDSAGTVVFQAWMAHLTRAVLADDLGVAFDPIYQGSVVTMETWTVRTLEGAFDGAARLVQQGRDVALLQALQQTRAWITERFGGVEPSRYRWDQVHRTRLPPVIAGYAPWDGATLATPGADGTVSVSNARFFSSGSTPAAWHESTSGAVYRFVTTFRDDGLPVSEVAFVRGNHEDASSRWFADTANAWRDGTYQPLRFERADVVRDAQESMTVRP